MRVLSYFILAYLALALNVANLHWGLLSVDWVMIVAVFVALFAPPPASYLGCLALGFLQDLLSPQIPLGYHALSYGLLALAGRSLSQSLYRTHPLTHAATAAIGWISLLFCFIVSGIIRGGVIESYPAFVVSGIVTIALTPVALLFLQTQRKWFLMSKMRRS